MFKTCANMCCLALQNPCLKKVKCFKCTLACSGAGILLARSWVRADLFWNGGHFKAVIQAKSVVFVWIHAVLRRTVWSARCLAFQYFQSWNALVTWNLSGEVVFAASFTVNIKCSAVQGSSKWNDSVISNRKYFQTQAIQLVAIGFFALLNANCAWVYT